MVLSMGRKFVVSQTDKLRLGVLILQVPKLVHGLELQ